VPICPGQQAPAEPELKELAVTEAGWLAVHVTLREELRDRCPGERVITDQHAAELPQP
jgi:hypothetical protein